MLDALPLPCSTFEFRGHGGVAVHFGVMACGRLFIPDRNGNVSGQLVQVSPSLCGYTFGVARTGKHLSDKEMDNIQKWKASSWAAVQIHKRLSTDRGRRRQAPPDLTTVRRFVKGKTSKRSATETRGRKKSLSFVGTQTGSFERTPSCT